MHADLSAEELEFRDEVRRFLADELPQGIRDKIKRNLSPSRDEFVRWQKILFAKGWAAPNWPVEYGGTGWTATQRHIWAGERAIAGAPRLIPFGMNMVGPVIYTFGTDEQKRRFLPAILASDAWWCQGFSEPNAGSDLASLRTTAVRDGDGYVVNGTKTWTTLAQYADWIFCLVRTGPPREKNQRAISFLLIDMSTPGVGVSPIITIDGEHEVNEVHFHNVRVPAANMIGPEGSGWTAAKFLLTFERTGIARIAHTQDRLGRLKRIAGATNNGGTPLADDPVFAHKVAEVEIDLLALEYTELRTLAAVSTGKSPGPESSILKIKGTEIAQAIDALYVEVAGYYSVPFVRDQFTDGFAGTAVGPDDACNAAPHYFNNRKASIYGGSNEIQKNIICKAVLGL
ncbi:MAG TPA: acyl-CoA dehydrogenase family protein [Woeseiaceae bacterium]|nr:acyl-CoA dehydrogenase family protein [Woeseiaceae bacterium]